MDPLREGTFGQGLDLGKVEADAMALTLSGPLHLRAGDLAGVRLAQPLRAGSARIDAYLPVARTFDGAIIRAHQSVDVAPTGRELDLEAAYATPLPELGLGRGANLRLNAYLARDAENRRAAAIEQGVVASLVISR